MGSRTCSELAVRIARSVSQKRRQASSNGQAAVLEQPPRLARLVGHDVLVLHVEHAARAATACQCAIILSYSR